ncbi:MAG: hypothetical protein JOZ46_10575 [Candidatus Dormibacteraeota bacterium]|nr:hypothetical protein [Candidatus Dormibacteraeota bacterium]MBV9526243.1 hypothetical protein [Candidatus Dormibacteraeota bacterium]
MIEETCLEIGELQEHWLAEKRARMARREQIHRIDDLIEEFEKLNLADEAEVPIELKGRATAVIASGPHPLELRAVEPVAIAEWMDALYDVQDTLMFAGDDSD